MYYYTVFRQLNVTVLLADLTVLRPHHSVFSVFLVFIALQWFIERIFSFPTRLLLLFKLEKLKGLTVITHKKIFITHKIFEWLVFF